jgi:arginine deiminase
MEEWGVYSEVGKLECVLVHQPGYEHRQTVPWNKDALLFDDIMDVEDARPEHKDFTHLLATHGAEVLFLEDLLREVCKDPSVRHKVYRDVLGARVLHHLNGANLRPEHLIKGYPDHYTLDAPVDVQPLPNLYFTRDPAFAVPGALVIARPAKPARHREARLVRAVFRYHPRFKDAVVYDGLLKDKEATIEGGDVHVIDEHTVMVGVGERTNNAGVNHLARFLFEHTPVTRVLKLHIPASRAFMHLDTVLTFVDRRRVLTMPYLWDRPKLYEDIARRSRKQCRGLGYDEDEVNERVPRPRDMRQTSKLEVVTRNKPKRTYDNAMKGLADLGIIDRAVTVYVAGRLGQYKKKEHHVVEALREQWNDAANALALKPGQVMGYSRNDRTFRALEEEGVEVVLFRGGELVRGRGGARCMSMPLRRSPA